MYKLSTNELLERTDKILCFMIAKKTKTMINASDWDLKIYHAMWVHNSIFKLATILFPFRLAYNIEALLPIEYKLMTLRTVSKTQLDLDAS